MLTCLYGSAACLCCCCCYSYYWCRWVIYELLITIANLCLVTFSQRVCNSLFVCLQTGAKQEAHRQTDKQTVRQLEMHKRKEEHQHHHHRRVEVLTCWSSCASSSEHANLSGASVRPANRQRRGSSTHKHSFSSLPDKVALELYAIVNINYLLLCSVSPFGRSSHEPGEKASFSLLSLRHSIAVLPVTLPLVTQHCPNSLLHTTTFAVPVIGIPQMAIADWWWWWWW